MSEDTKGESALEKACAAVGRDRNPAYVKDSELRYIAVNEAYAALWDMSAAALIGAKSHQHFDAAEQNDRDEKERRSLVFGKDQTALFAHPLKDGRYRIRIRRDRHGDGRPFITGHFEPIAGVRFETGEAPAPASASVPTPRPSERAYVAVDLPEPVLRGDHDLLKAAIEKAPIPLGVMDAAGRLLAASPAFRTSAARLEEVALPGGGKLQYAVPREPARNEFGVPTMSSVAQVADSLSARLRESLDCIDAGIVIYDPDDTVVYVNPAMRAISEGAHRMEPGMTLREVLLSAWECGAGERDAQELENWIERRIAAHRACGVATVAKIGNGRWLRFIHRRLADGSTLGLRMDISELMEHELALEEKVTENSLYRAVLDALPIASFIKDENFRYVYGNGEMAKLAGYDLADIIGRDDVELHGPQSKPIRESDTAVLADGESREIELPIHRPQGDDLTLLTRKVRFTAPNGRNYLLGSTFDISAIKQREQDVDVARQVAEQHRSDLESTLDAMQMGVVVLDRDMRIELVNNAFFQTWMLKPYDEIIGEHFRDFMDRNRQPDTHDISDPDWAAYVETRLEEIVAGNVEPREIGRKNGSTVIYSVRPLSGGKRLLSYFDVTELKHRESEIDDARRVIEHARSDLESTLDSMQMGVVVVNRDLDIEIINNAFYEIWKLNPEDGKVGTPFRDIIEFNRHNNIYPIPENEFDSYIEMRLAEITRGYVEAREFARADGRTVIYSVRPLSDGKRMVSYFDITELKQREAELVAARREVEHSGALLQAAASHMVQGLAVLRDGKAMFVNGKFCELLDVPREVVAPGKSWSDFVAHCAARGDYDYTGRDETVARILASLDDCSAYTADRRIADGRWFRVDAVPAEGNMMVVTYTDVTEAKSREKELTEARHEVERASTLMQAATRAMAQGMFIVDVEQTLFANRKFMEMLNVPAEIVEPGRDWRDFLDYCIERGDYDSTGREESRQHIVDCIENNVGYTAERKMSDGHWLRIDALPADNKIMVVTYTDVTEAKERETQLNELLGKAEIADRAKSEFLANMSHEIRTPMNGVLGMAELLSRTNLDSRQRTFTDIIVKSGTALLTIINDILDFSKIDAGQMVLDEAPFDLRETIEDVATLVSARAVEKDVELIVRIDPALESRVIGDVGRVRQVITNIAGNAVKFTETGHVLIELSGERRPGERLAVKLRVEDTGIGIPADKLGEIFEKFSQVDNSSTRRHEGTGLGLAITSRLVALMGGTIRAESKSVYGKGSVFIVELDMPIDKKPVRAKPVPIDVTGSRILVIDDNPVNRAILIEQLSAWGFDACAAESGDEGENVLAAASRYGIAVDAAILDYHMPERNGAMVARSIRKTYTATDLPIVMLTSMDVRTAEPGFNEIGVQATLMKPARSSLLLETIIETLQANSARKAEAAGPAAAAQPAPQPTTAPTSVVEIRPTASRPVEAETPRPPSGLDILVAEDNEVNQIVFTQILEDMGLRYLIVDNGSAAVDTWKQLRPAMILMDVSMPVMNGHQATGAIRAAEGADASLGHTPIVGVTAHALTGDRERCLEAGMDDYLSKPISPEKLEAKVREWLPAEAVARMAQG